MTEDEVIAEFRAADALLEGHFILSSGLRSPRYLQCARVLMNPARAAKLTNALAARIPDEIKARLDAVVSPAMGGVIAGHEMGRASAWTPCSWSGRPALSNCAGASRSRQAPRC
jgi:orotate phosphoribosyltransferase